MRMVAIPSNGEDDLEEISLLDNSDFAVAGVDDVNDDDDDDDVAMAAAKRRLLATNKSKDRDGGGDDNDVRRTLLLRPTSSGRPGVYAYHLHRRQSNEEEEDGRGAASGSGGGSGNDDGENIRATRLAMSCGMLGARLYGDVVVGRSATGTAGSPTATTTMSAGEVRAACLFGPDLRVSVLEEVAASSSTSSSSSKSSPLLPSFQLDAVPEWLSNAAMDGYHDGEVLERLAEAMTEEEEELDDEEEEHSSSSDSEDDDGADGSSSSSTSEGGATAEEAVLPVIAAPRGCAVTSSQRRRLGTPRGRSRRKGKEPAATTVPLCLHCRRPATALCGKCRGAYFCSSDGDDDDNDEGANSSASPSSAKPALATRSNSSCLRRGWSHECFCPTWKIYVRRRDELSTFPGLRSWAKELVGRALQLSDAPYEAFLSERKLGAATPDGEATNTTTWWRTEVGGGWSGGEGDGARAVDAARRLTYAEGFHPLGEEEIPREGPVCREEGDRILPPATRSSNQLGMVRLSSWDEYYRLRGISGESPAALLLTFPLTLYFAIVEHGEVPCTVARMLNRPLRIHVVGAEKELNFLDLFREVSYLLNMPAAGVGGDCRASSLELVFIVRDDMLPPKLRDETGQHRIALERDLQVVVVGGTYGDSLDPNFDCGSGPPDMVVAFNAGLHAYGSWRSVVRYLDRHTGVVGAFTDYNEMSAVQCAGLGGAASRDSVCVNPFRQPRAMPVYCMNLPQFSNGFMYVFNQKALD